MFKQIFEIFKSDSLYEQALSECHEMLDIDLTMFKESIKSLRESDSTDINIDIFAMDKKINEFERDVRRKVMTHLAIGGKEDIGSGLVLVSVVIDIERIGDYTKNIYDLAVNHPKKLIGGSIEDRLSEIEKISFNLFEESIYAFKNQDIEKARGLMGHYKDNISSQSDAITNEIITGEVSDLDVGSASAVGLYSRYLKRIAAHSRNIISSVVNPFERIGYPEK
ncbi:MAG: PhoU domain-containing protein [Candidatus Marinimicrobia bacterium]|jgi:phosphate uptake regulator|nr:PhoU domain-containing protein [Candidatus Neomarinimicrobiota bacterium]